MDNEQDSNAAVNELRVRDLQSEKLQPESRKLNRPWFCRPSYLAGLTPILLIMVALIAAWAFGLFDQQSATLSSKIAELESQKEKLDAQVVAAMEERDQAIEDEKKIRRKLNEVYLKVKLWNFNANYVVGMVDWKSEEVDMNYLKEFVGDLDDVELKNRFSRLFDNFAIGQKTMDFVMKKNVAVNEFLIEMPASSRAKSLVPNPDQTLTDLVTGNQYSVDEIGDFLDEND